MTSFYNSILIGLHNFPFFAILLTIPMLFVHFTYYKKINLIRIGISYAFLLYALCFIALVFFPLPSISDAATLSTHDLVVSLDACS